MSGEIVVPSVGESITEVVVIGWLVDVGSYVAVDTPVVALETDKASVEVPAPIGGFLRSVEKQVEDVAEVGALLGMIEAGEPPEDFGKEEAPVEPASPQTQESIAMPSAQSRRNW